MSAAALARVLPDPVQLDSALDDLGVTAEQLAHLQREHALASIHVADAARLPVRVVWRCLRSAQDAGAWATEAALALQPGTIEELAAADPPMGYWLGHRPQCQE
jgi:hypothetical protein